MWSSSRATPARPGHSCLAEAIGRCRVPLATKAITRMRSRVALAEARAALPRGIGISGEKLYPYVRAAELRP